MMAPAPGTGKEVVDLEPVTAPTTIDRTDPQIPGPDQGPEGGGDRLPQVGIGDLVELGDDQPHLSPTEDLGEKVRSQLGTGREGDPGFPRALLGQLGVDQDLGHGQRPALSPLLPAPGERIETDGGQGIHSPLSVALALQHRELGLPLV
jgi:hypothetical protein